MRFRSRKPTFSIGIARAALESVFDECDHSSVDETGGRLIGTYRHQDGHYDIEVRGVLEPGPNAQRTPTYFLQDGDHQEKLFRAIEANHPDIEHLGNWHTHHVNGYPTLSGGDKETYFRIVNHEKHNTNFFYALLVVSQNRGGDPRYAVKHFVFRRGDDGMYEIPARDVQLIDALPLQPRLPGAGIETLDPPSRSPAGNPQRAKDQEFFADFYPDLRPLLAKQTGTPYWKGALSLIDGSRAEVVAMEDAEDEQTPYSVTTSCKDPAVADVRERYKQQKFRSARHAILHFEHDLNRALYSSKRGVRP